MQLVQLPSFWEKLIQQYVKKTFLKGTRKDIFAERVQFTRADYNFFVSGVRALNTAFTQERSNFPVNYFNRKDWRSGYLVYFLPVNALKVKVLLEQNAASLTPMLKKGEFQLVDVGSGPGTGAIGFLGFLEDWCRANRVRRLSLKIDLLDQNTHALKDAQSLIQDYVAYFHNQLRINLDVKVKTHVSDLSRDRFLNSLTALPKADLMMALNALSELPQGFRKSVAQKLIQKLATADSRLLIMEPALRITSRDLMQLRDELVLDKKASVYAPCLHQKECPMFRDNERDWCHAYVPWQRPLFIETFDKLVGIKKDYLKCSYMYLGAPSATGVKESPNLWRVVSGPLNSKGKTERLFCGTASRELFRPFRTDRDESTENMAFGFLERGDIVHMKPLDDEMRIYPETGVKKI